VRHVPHCFTPSPWTGDVLRLSAETSRHLELVLRLHPGDVVTYTDGAGTLGEGTWDGAALRRGEELEVPIPEREVTIAVAPPKGIDRQRFVVEKLAELGVGRLVWLHARYGDANAPKRMKSLAWAVGALEQSRGARMLDVSGPLALGQLHGRVVLAHPGGAQLGDIDGSLTIAIGPAGGWHPGEIAAAGGTVSLGDRVLRTETAAIVAATIAMIR
jgi:16S rRNA (uracil1498-N3)-methyltransferase